jgi:hypothetical protein
MWRSASAQMAANPKQEKEKDRHLKKKNVRLHSTVTKATPTMIEKRPIRLFDPRSKHKTAATASNSQRKQRKESLCTKQFLDKSQR